MQSLRLPFCVFVLSFTLLFYPNCSASSSNNSDRLKTIKKWFILLTYDGSKSKSSAAEIKKFEMAILDPDNHPKLDELRGKLILIAYVSLGEAEQYRFYWDTIKDKRWVLDENPNWGGNYLVDVRSKKWKKLIIDEVIADVISQGFDGIMMDTLDTSEVIEENFPGASKAMVKLVKDIRKKYPELLLISNNGFSILEQIAPYLDGMLVEDINMMIDFENDKYMKVPQETREYKISILEKVMEKYSLPVFNIDYVLREDKKLVKKCVDVSKQLGFRPYVAEKDLDRIYDN